MKLLGDILKAGAEFLEKSNIENARLQCELLASRLMKCKRLELPGIYQQSLSEKQVEAMRRGVKRLSDGEPVQYIIGEAGFMGHIFKADKRALIPRPETEVLVDLILKTEDLWTGKTSAVVEVGVGSGCIIVSLAIEKPESLFIGLDISEKALALAEENAEALGVGGRVAFSVGELADIVDAESIDCIVANLPYIPTSDYEELPVCIRDHEPRAALDGGADGLKIIGPIVQDASFALKPGGYLFLEIGEEQGGAVIGMLKEAGFASVELKQDLNGRDRIVTGKLSSI